MPKDNAHQSGILSLDGHIISYVSSHFGSFSVPVAEVAVIGEFTTDNGPFIDDWFLACICRDGNWFEASAYADGFNDVLEGLSAILGTSVCCELYGAADFASRIIWPSSLAGHPLFEFSGAAGAGFLQRLRLAILPQICRSLTPEVLVVINAAR